MIGPAYGWYRNQNAAPTTKTTRTTRAPATHPLCWPRASLAPGAADAVIAPTTASQFIRA